MAVWFCRSRKGAWIEIAAPLYAMPCVVCRSRKGAWIEITTILIPKDGAKSRSRKGAWIEMTPVAAAVMSSTVAPVRERGLKYICMCNTPQ